MKTGRNIQEVLREVQRQAAAKEDFVVPTPMLRMTPTGAIEVPGRGEYFATDHTHAQISERIKINKPYYDRMKTEAPDLLATNVNHWFKAQPEKRMLRTMTLERPQARAFLSDRYRRLDNYDMAINVLPELAAQQLEIISCEITDVKLYIKFLTPRVQGEVKKGDIVQAGGVISNSEIGMGAISVMPFLNRLVCTNGMIASDFGQRKSHVGRAAQSDEEAFAIYTDETLQADDKAFWLKTRDTVRAVLEQSKFDKLLERLRESTKQQIEGDIPQVVEVLANKYSLDETEKNGVLKHLIEDGVGLNAWGLANAITSVAGESAGYDRATELERLGGKLIELAPTQWKEIASVKA